MDFGGAEPAEKGPREMDPSLKGNAGDTYVKCGKCQACYPMELEVCAQADRQRRNNDLPIAAQSDECRVAGAAANPARRRAAAASPMALTCSHRTLLSTL